MDVSDQIVCDFVFTTRSVVILYCNTSRKWSIIGFPKKKHAVLQIQSSLDPQALASPLLR